MIIDTLEHLGRYLGMSKPLDEAIRFILNSNLKDLPLGKHLICADGSSFANVVEAQPKKREAARLETHNAMLDIQIPVSGVETMGYTPRADLPETEYNTADDISFYSDEARFYFTVKPGEFVIFFPEDGHAPAITSEPLKKIICKVPDTFGAR